MAGRVKATREKWGGLLLMIFTWKDHTANVLDTVDITLNDLSPVCFRQ